MSIPTIDLKQGEAVCASQLKQACETTGFFFLKGHDVQRQHVDKLFQGARAFFNLEQATKDRHRASADQEPFGYQSAIKENIKLGGDTQKLPDQREQLKFGKFWYLQDFNSLVRKNETKQIVHDEKDMIFLGEFECNWKENVKAYYEHMSKIGFQLLRLVAISLELDPEYFHASFSRPLELMNINYYHPVASRIDIGKCGCGSHTDYGMMTILTTDSVAGLQVCKDKSVPVSDQEWINVQPQEDSFIINVGDMLEQWTNGQYVSNLHRVNKLSNEERLSVAFFFEPNANAIISPLSCCKGNKDKKYDDVQYSEWLAAKYHQTGELVS